MAGEEHAESAPKCSTGTCYVKLDKDEDEEEDRWVVRHVMDVAKVQT